MKITRCSSLPLIIKCGAAAIAPLRPIRKEHPLALEGTVAHELLRKLPQGARIEDDDIQAAASQYGADPKGLALLCRNGKTLWFELREFFQGADDETYLEHEIIPGKLKLTGHSDLLRIQGKTARGADWKCGYLDKDYREQMMGYNALVLSTHPELQESSFTLLWVRDKQHETHTLRREDLDGWIRRLNDKIESGFDGYDIGDHCVYCPRSQECDGFDDYTRLALRPFVTTEVELKEDVQATLERMEPSEIILRYQQAKAVKALAERFEEAVRLRVIGNGPIQGNQYEIAATEQARRDVLPEKAWDTLLDVLTPDELPRALKIRLSEAENMVAAKAPKRGGAAAKRDLKQRLEAAEAIVYTTSYRLGIRRRKALPESKG